MGEFFQGWRRKTGVWTLAMASVFVFGWARSFAHTDSWWISTPQIRHMVTSQRGAIRWGKETPNADHDFSVDFSEVPEAKYRDHDTFWRGYEMKWRYGFGDFDFGDGTENAVGQKYRMERWCLPYWSIVIPLTLISAFVLLTKPRKSTQNKISEPTAIEEA